MMTRCMRTGMAVMLVLVGCSTYQVVPNHLKGQVRQDIQLTQVEQAPGSYKGQTVVWGGEIVDINRQDQHTTVEIFQLPLDQTLRPIDPPSASKGRFLAMDVHGDTDITDPHRLKKGTRVTVIGEVQGLVSVKLDQDRHDIPALLIRDMTAWDYETGKTWYPYTRRFYDYQPYTFWEGRRVAKE